MKSFGKNFDKIIKRAKENCSKTIILPEGEDDRIINASKMVIDSKLCKLILLGDEKIITKKLGVYSKNLLIINPIKYDKIDTFANSFYELRKHKGVTIDEAKKLVTEKMHFACMLLKMGLADGIVSGATMPTANVLRPAFQIIKTKPNVNIASSVFILECNEGSGIGENGFLVVGDCAVIPNPTAENLVDITVMSSETAKNICNINPRIALLSYTSNVKESEDEDILKVKEAVKVLNEQYTNLEVDGEMQVDCALNSTVRQLKYPNSKLTNNANTLIFPSVMSGNIAYKLASNLAKIKAVGPIIQGLNKPVNDLSRSAKSDEIYLLIAITLLQVN